ncbi:MAG: nickel pincer cofactor biosynthesis protein LarC [Nitrospirota bacterium]|nr:nickel pincer cofactor biosynthesis protein LarC [Nitrospirota bacterium]
MKIAYFDCFSGISGDMILGALVDAGVPFDRLKEGLSKLKLDGYTLTASTVLKKGIKATKVDVVIESPELPGRPLRDLREIISESALDLSVKEKSLSIIQRLARAEAVVHNCPVEEVHFHEVGHIDTIVDVVGAVYGLQLLDAGRVVSSPIDTGSGYVRMSHGVFPIPAPATAELLKGTPVYSSGIERELTTPTGAAIITTMASSFQALPEMTLSAIGYGAGGWNLDKKANVLRLLVGEDIQGYDADEVMLLETHIDDMNPQIYEYLIERLLQAGALDVCLTPTIMKKSRPAHILSIVTKVEDLDAIRRLVFKETTTLGIRSSKVTRSVLRREIKEVDLPYGRVRVKVSRGPDGVSNISPEYEDCKRLALESEVPLKDIIDMVKRLSGSRLS